MIHTDGFDFPLMPDDDIMADLESIIERRSYPSRNDKIRLVDEKFRIITEAMTRHFANIDAENMGYTGEILNRRKAAVCNCIEKALKECPKEANRMISIEETVVGLEAGPSRTTYGGLDMQEFVLMAASIWILDDLKKNGRIYDAYEFLPQDYDDIISMDTPLNFYDPCFEVELIQSVMSVIHNRNRKAGKRPGFWQDFEDPHDATGRKPSAKESEDRRRFEGLMGLIDPDHAKSAGDVFKEKVWDAVRRYIEAMDALDRQDFHAVQRVRQRSSGQPSILMVNPNADNERDMMLAVKDAMETLDETNRVRRNLDIAFEDLIGMDVDEVRDKIGNARAARKVAGFTIDDPYEICFGLLYLMDQGDDAPWLFHTGYCVLWNAAKLLPWFTPLEHIADDEEWDNEEWDEWDGGELTYNQGGWIQRQEKEGSEDKTDYYHTKYGDQNIAQIIFDMTGASVPRNLHPFEEKRKELKENGMDEALADRVIAEAEIFFLTQFQSKARNFEGAGWFEFGGNEDKQDDSSGLTEEKAGHTDEPANTEPDKTEKKTLTGYWGNVASGQMLDVEKKVENAHVGGWITSKNPTQHSPQPTQPAEKKASDKRLKEENKGLRKALSELSRQSAQEKAKLEKELEALRREHRELADLRELVFNRENDVETAVDSQGTGDISFPYETKKRTVVFGGHETFLKQFRPKFSNVRFVDAEQYAFSPDIIRNADIVWIQNNRISHSQYYRIINTTRQYGIQVRYFPYASADKCAEELVKEDMKG